MPETPKPKTYGCIVTVEIRTSIMSSESRRFNWRGSEASCRRKGMLQSGAISVTAIESLDEATYVRAFGLAQRM
jgi:hypothetical protein